MIKPSEIVRNLFAFFIFSLHGFLLHAQEFKFYEVQPSAISIGLDYVLFEHPSSNFLRNNAVGLGVAFHAGLDTHWEYEVGVSGLNTELYKKDGQSFSAGQKLFFAEAAAMLRYNLVPAGRSLIPFFKGGIGASFYDGHSGGMIPMGIGAQWNLSRSLFSILSLERHQTILSQQDSRFLVSLSLGGNIGKADRHNSSKKIRALPDDTDGDSIIDEKDACPIIPGIPLYNGCPVPDSDKDGINDANDSCPTDPGVSRYQGCPIPDRDKDGVNDESDSCVDVFGFLRYHGCPITRILMETV